MASTSDIKNGMCIKHNSALWTITEFLHVKPGKGAAFVRTKLKNVTTGKVLDHTFPAGAKIEQVRVERRTYQFLYKDGTDYHVMNTETYEQIMLQEEMIMGHQFLKDGDNIEVQFHAEEEMPLTADAPNAVVLEVTYTEPGLKGDTATNAMKYATLETGAEIRVPLFINTGDKVKVLTANGEYSERVKA